jgi:hypothetical protein
VEAAGKPEYLDNLIEEFEMYTENKLKEGTKEQENFNGIPSTISKES